MSSGYTPPTSSGPCIFFSQFGVLPSNAFTWTTSNGFNGRIHAVVCNSGTQTGSATITFSVPSWVQVSGSTTVNTGDISPNNCVTIDIPISVPPLYWSSNTPPTANSPPANLPSGCPVSCSLTLECLNECTGNCGGTISASISGGSAGSRGCNTYGFPSGSGASVSVNFGAYIQACQQSTGISGGGGFIPGGGGGTTTTQPSQPSQPTQQKQQGGGYLPPGAQPTQTKTQPGLPPAAVASPPPNNPTIYAVVFAIPDISLVDTSTGVADPQAISRILTKTSEAFRGIHDKYAEELNELNQYLQELQSGSSAMVAMQALPPSLQAFLSNVARMKYVKVYKLSANELVNDVIEVPPAQRTGTHIGALVVIYIIPNTITSTGAISMDIKGRIIPMSATTSNTSQSGSVVATYSYETVFVPVLDISITGTASASGVPGQQVTLTYIVTNSSNVSATITLQVTDPYGTSITRTESAPACSSSPCPTVTFNIPYTIPFSAQPGSSYNVTATATATYQGASSQPVSTTTTINVLQQSQAQLSYLSIVPSQTFYCVNPGSTVTISANVTNSSSSQQQVVAELLDQNGTTIQSQPITVPANGSVPVSFNLVAPMNLGYYYYQVAVASGSTILNSSYIAIDVSTSCAQPTIQAAAQPTVSPTAAQAQQLQQLMQVMTVFMLTTVMMNLMTAIASL